MPGPSWVRGPMGGSGRGLGATPAAPCLLLELGLALRGDGDGPPPQGCLTLLRHPRETGQSPSKDGGCLQRVGRVGRLNLRRDLQPRSLGSSSCRVGVGEGDKYLVEEFFSFKTPEDTPLPAPGRARGLYFRHAGTPAPSPPPRFSPQQCGVGVSLR